MNRAIIAQTEEWKLLLKHSNFISSVMFQLQLFLISAYFGSPLCVSVCVCGVFGPERHICVRQIKEGESCVVRVYLYTWP